MPSRPCFALALLIEKNHCIIRREWSSLRAEPFHSAQILYQTAPPYVVPESLSSEILQASERTLGEHRCWKEESLFAMWSHKSSREPRSVQLFVCRDAKVTAGPPTFDHVSRLTAIVSIDAPDCTFSWASIILKPSSSSSTRIGQLWGRASRPSGTS